MMMMMMMINVAVSL